MLLLIRTNRIQYNSNRKFNSKITQKLKVINNYVYKKKLFKIVIYFFCGISKSLKSVKRKILLLNKKKILFLIFHHNFYFSIYFIYVFFDYVFFFEIFYCCKNILQSKCLSFWTVCNKHTRLNYRAPERASRCSN